MGPGPYSQKAEGWLTARPPTQNSWPVGPSGPPGPPRPGPPRPGLEEPHQVDGTPCAPQHGCLKHRMEALGDTGGTLVSLCAGEETEARGVAGSECRAGLSLPLFSIQAKLVEAPISRTCAGARTQEEGGAAPGLGAADSGMGLGDG